LSVPWVHSSHIAELFSPRLQRQQIDGEEVAPSFERGDAAVGSLRRRCL
jgi:hypothetical protein